MTFTKEFIAGIRSQFEQERDYLDARCAEFEKLAREFVNYEIDQFIARIHFEALLNDEKDGE